MLGSSSVNAEIQTSPKQNGHCNFNGNAVTQRR